MLALLCLPLVTFAQPFPSKPIELIALSTLGDSADLVARVISAKLAERCLQLIDGFKLDKLPLVRCGRHTGSREKKPHGASQYLINCCVRNRATYPIA